MALSFAGNGTITGLSVGGLPDGTVDEDTLANNAVGAGKLASGVGGKVLQAIGASNTVQRSTTSTSWVDASNTLTVAITPAATSSKFFITVSGSHSNGNTSGQAWMATVFRDSTNLGHADYGLSGYLVINSSPANRNFAFNYLDSPNASSQITYQVKFMVDSGTGTLSQNSSTSHITVMEIGA